MRLGWSAMFALGISGIARAQDQDGVKDLLERVRKLEEREAVREKAAPPTWDSSRMLSFASADGSFTAKVGGRIYLNYRHIFDRDDGSGGDVDTFFLDTARLQADGTFFKDFFYRVELEAQTSTGTQTVDIDEGPGVTNVTITAGRGRPQLKDTYLGWTIVPEHLSLQGGQMKTPWSQEETCSSRFIDFGERSLLNRLAPAHDMGLLFRGSFAEKIFEWSLGVFNGAFVRDGGRNSPDTNDEKDAVGRLFITPFRTSGAKFIEQLRIGGDFTVGDRDDLPVAGASVTAGDLGVGVVNPIAGGGFTADGLQTRYLFNASWIYGPASLRAEYAVVNTELNDAAPEGDFDITAYYLQGTLLLTGEDKPLENRIKPRATLNLSEGTFGAFELAARIARVDTSDGEDAGVVAATANPKTTEVTLGVNWWWTPNVALRINWERLSYDEDRLVGSGDSLEDKQDIFYVRWQIDF